MYTGDKNIDDQSCSLLYKCIAPNYFKEVYDDAGTNLDYLKEVCCTQLKSVYTKKQIKDMSEFGIDLWKGLIWIDHTKLIHDYSIIVTGEKYRLTLLKNKLPGLTDVLKERIKRMVDTRSFYTIEEIKQLSIRLGIDLWENAVWQTFKEKKLLKNGEGRDILFYVPDEEPVQMTI